MAAANRARQVVEGYPSTPAVIDALVVMHLAFEALGLPLESKMRCLYSLKTILNTSQVSGNQRLAAGVYTKKEKRSPASSHSGLWGVGQPRRPACTPSIQSRRLDTSRRPPATLRPAEDPPAVNAPRVVNEVFF